MKLSRPDSTRSGLADMLAAQREKRKPMIECVACGRRLTNEEGAENQAAWTYGEPRRPYCADSDDCRRDAENAQ